MRTKLANKGIEAFKTIMSSDETDPKWWAEIEARGWYPVDHARMHTEERLGAWYVTIH